LGGASLLGILVLLIILSFFLSPPPWVGDVLGVLLVLGGVAFAWLVASALGQGRSSRGSNDVVGLDRDGPADSMRRRRQ
jgi:hypothetical protein